MIHYDLAGEWSLTAPEKYACTGQIPGSVYSFLLASGQMDDPYYRENELPALALMENDTWTEVPVPACGGRTATATSRCTPSGSSCWKPTQTAC